MCKAHDPHECYVTARVLRMDCPDHGSKQVKMLWTREGSRFTLLFEQAGTTLVREMLVLAAARTIGISDTRLWRVSRFTGARPCPKRGSRSWLWTKPPPTGAATTSPSS
ncbi:hypothetical protein DFAR_3730004 [Desulfarculales bacterium]